MSLTDSKLLSLKDKLALEEAELRAELEAVVKDKKRASKEEKAEKPKSRAKKKD